MIKSIIRYIFILVLAIIFSLLYESYELTYLFIFLLILPLVNIIMVNYSSKKITVILHTNVSVVNKGKNVPINLEIINKGLLPVMWIEAEFVCKNNYNSTMNNMSFLIPILKYGKQEYIFNIKSEYCGDINIVFKSIKYMDYFKLYYKKRSIDNSVRAYVLPQVGNIEDIEIERKNIIDIEGEKFSEYKPGDDPSEVFDIREFRPADKIHSIHWKLSARRQDIMVKEYSLPINGYYSVIVDLACKEKNKAKEYIDGITETALAVMMRLQQGGINHYLIGCERDGKSCYKDIIDIDMPFTDTIFELYKSKCCSSADILDRIECSDIMKNESQIYYITSNVNEENIIKLEQMYTNSYKKIIAVLHGEIDDKIRNLAIANEIDIEVVQIDDSLNSISSLTL